MIAPLVFTNLFALAIAPSRSVQLPGAPYWLAAMLLATGFLIAWSVIRKSEGAVLTEAEAAK
jgi:DHA1 family tetracycline resistance protein-like MFS transporter